MPMYEYECADCGVVTEALRKVADADSPIRCERCDSPRVSRQHSVFTAGRATEPAGYAPPRTDAGGCGHCGNPYGSCGM